MHRKDSIVKMLEPEGKAEAPCWTTETEKEHIRRVRGLDIPWPHHPPPCGEKWEYGFHNGKREPEVDNQHMGHFQEAHSGLASWRSSEESARLDYWGSERDGEGGRSLQQTLLRLWKTAFLLISVPEQRFPASNSGHLQSWASGPFWLGSSVGSSTWFGPTINGPDWKWSLFYHPAHEGKQILSLAQVLSIASSLSFQEAWPGNRAATSPSYSPTWSGSQTSSPAQLVRIATGPAKPESWNSDPGWQGNPAYGTARQGEPTLQSHSAMDPSLTTLISREAQSTALPNCWTQSAALPRQEAQPVILPNQEA